MRLPDFRVTAIARTLCNYSCDFSFVAVFCSRKALDIFDKLHDLSVLNLLLVRDCRFLFLF